MLVATVVYFYMTLISSSRPDDLPLWKSSALATLREGHEVGYLLADADTVQDMEVIARNTDVKADETYLAQKSTRETTK